MLKRNNIMQNPKMYIMLKDKEDGIKFGGKNGFAYLSAHTKVMLPSDIGNILVKDGYAKEIE